MHILLTDILSCPRCEPGSGLILLADRVEARRVYEGVLGCPTCRAKYSVRSAVADLRVDADAAGEADGPEGPAEAPDRALRWAALMGVAEGPGFLLLLGRPAAGHAAAIAAMIEGVEVIEACGGENEVDAPVVQGLSRIRVDRRLPLYGARVRGVALSGPSASGPLLEEAARVLGAGGRLVIEPAPEDAQERLEASGLRVLAREGDTIVAVRG